MACTNGEVKVVEALIAKNIPTDPLDKVRCGVCKGWRHFNLPPSPLTPLLHGFFLLYLLFAPALHLWMY